MYRQLAQEGSGGGYLPKRGDREGDKRYGLFEKRWPGRLRQAEKKMQKRAREKEKENIKGNIKYRSQFVYYTLVLCHVCLFGDLPTETLLALCTPFFNMINTERAQQTNNNKITPIPITQRKPKQPEKRHDRDERDRLAVLEHITFNLSNFFFHPSAPHL